MEWSAAARIVQESASEDGLWLRVPMDRTHLYVLDPRAAREASMSRVITSLLSTIYIERKQAHGRRGA